MKKRSTVVVILTACLLIAVTITSTWMVFRQNRRSTLDSGTYRLEAISGELESTISSGGELAMELALSIREYLDDRDALEDYIRARKSEIIADGTGVFNVYVAGSDWSFIPDFDMPDDYIPTERVWYTGAVRNHGHIYVSPPYQDAMTGDICYSISVVLGDGETVVAVDYTMESIQTHIAHMYATDRGKAVIVTDEGIIAGCSDESLIGEKLTDVLPDYAGMYALSKNSEGVSTVRIREGALYETLFGTKSGNGWYLIVSESDRELYRDSYMQLLMLIVFSVMLLSAIVILFLRAERSRRRVQEALDSRDDFLNNITGELREPLKRILYISDEGGHNEEVGVAEYREDLAGIHLAGEKLSEMISQIISYSTIVRTERENNSRRSVRQNKKGINRRFRVVILIVMIAVMIVSLYVNITATWRWGNEMVIREADSYEFRLSEWINTQKSILDMFVSIISVNPDMLNDYEGTIELLDDITAQYPEISVTYMASPALDPCVYMNNGWTPEPGWRVDERQWYVDTWTSADGWTVSAPYYDEQTGGYCVTISERVYDASNGAFLGIFGIDFFMDKLVEILGDSYSDMGYAFLVDTDGDIINHPYGSYQMSPDIQTNVSALPYAQILTDGYSTRLIRDYDGVRRIMTAVRDRESDFIVYVAMDFMKIYNRAFIYIAICLFAFIICIVLVYQLLTNLIRIQDEAGLRMQQAADAAIAADAAKSRFLAQMSHEIRTPINAVLGMNEMILRESDDPGILEYSGNIRSAGRTLLSIINSILDFSKIEDGKMEIAPVRYGTVTMINNLVNSIYERARGKGLELVLEVDEKLPSVLYGDDVRIEQVIMNLLTNAVKYTERGTVTFTVRDEGHTDGYATIYVEVRDTGIGIREEDMGRLFESFGRLDERRNRSIEGTGLGMSIVTKLLAMMDSKLEVVSEYGRGSVFSFRIRQEIISAEPIGDFTARNTAITDEHSDEGVMTAPSAAVLVVDDNDMNLKVASSFLKLYHITPDTATSGRQAIEMVHGRRYDIIFLDHMMPVMDGVETLAQLRSEDIELPPVIALTANAVVGSREKYLAAGFDDYISKPIEIEELREKLVRYLPEELVHFEMKMSEVDVEDDDVMEFAPVIDQGPDYVRMDADELTARLAPVGIDVAEGMKHSMDDISLYMELLTDYANESGKQISELDAFLNSKNLSEYGILIHAIKSTSRTIGAMEIGEEAYRLETAARDLDADGVTAHHSEFTEHFRRLAVEILESLP